MSKIDEAEGVLRSVGMPNPKQEQPMAAFLFLNFLKIGCPQTSKKRQYVV